MSSFKQEGGQVELVDGDVTICVRKTDHLRTERAGVGRLSLDAVDFTGVVVVLVGCQSGRWSKSMEKE